MTRKFEQIANHNIQKLLNTLIDQSIEPKFYRETMFNLGLSLGHAVLEKIDRPDASVYLACTVEDADFLAKGMLVCLQEKLSSVAFACFWNQRFSPFDIEDLKVAPIIKKYQEPSQAKTDYLIMLKSIISGACVVKTNLVNLIQKIAPEKIFIAAPVMYYTAPEKLKKEFDEKIYEKFDFLYFALDDERTETGEVIPGIGGIVYDRLGFSGQEGKNDYVPELVKTRRAQLVKVLTKV